MQHPVCPHCGEALKAFELPDNTGWEGDFQLACFNDDCPYFVRGWQHMDQNFSVKASYRYRVNPQTGEASPLAVWSADAVKDRILDADISESIETSSDDPSEKGPGE
jgi:hypothetical protein